MADLNHERKQKSEKKQRNQNPSLKKKEKDSKDNSNNKKQNITSKTPENSIGKQKQQQNSEQKFSEEEERQVESKDSTSVKPKRKRKQDMVSDEPPKLKGKKLPRVSTPSTSPLIKPHEPTTELEVHTSLHPRERSFDDVSQSLLLSQQQQQTSLTTAPLSSVFKSTQSIQQKYKPDPKMISCINNYDQREESFLARQWMTAEQIERGNSRWNPIASCYAILFYAHKIQKWPLEEARVVTTYDVNAVKLSLVIPQIYKIYDIERRLEESSSLVKLLVYCIASMNSFGIIRPIIFKGISNSGGQMEKLCASKQHYDRVPYYVSWPWRITSKHAYVMIDRSKMIEIDLDRTFLYELHSQRNAKKLLNDIPDWVYSLVKI